MALFQAQFLNVSILWYTLFSIGLVEEKAMKIYSTRAFADNKVGRWRELMASLNWPIDFRDYDEDSFEAETRITKFQSLTFLNHKIWPILAERNENHLASSNAQHFVLNHFLSGKVTLFHHGRYTTLGPGDFVLADATAPSQILYHRPMHILSVRIPRHQLASRIASPKNLCNRPLLKSEGFAEILAKLLGNLWEKSTEEVPEELATLSTRSLLGLLTTSYAMSYGLDIEETAAEDSRLFRIKRYIDSNLSDPDLTPENIAGAFGFSSRYLRKLFAKESEGVWQYIQRRRLEECANQLTHPDWKSRTITDIAHSWAFNSSAQFARSFKARYGITPSDYKQTHFRGDAFTDRSDRDD